MKKIIFSVIIPTYNRVEKLKKAINSVINQTYKNWEIIIVDNHSKDGTKKWLFKLSDGKEIETVFIPEGKRGTICVSSQVGCSLSCSFCYTGTMKFERNLELEEIVGQVITVKHFLEDWKKETDEKIVTNIVFMGMGEPLLNYGNVINAIKVLCDTEGLAISKRKITLSTSGIVNKIKDFQRDTDVNLAVSLHAAFDKIRDELVPVNKKWPIATLLKELKIYNNAERKKRITFEYIMLDGVNDSPSDAMDLARLLKGIHAKVNLIPFNKWPGAKFRSSPPRVVKRFSQILNDNQLSAPIRVPRGRDIMAACGQLKSASEQIRKLPSAGTAKALVT